jgi:type IV pilus assembly protein PilF
VTPAGAVMIVATMALGGIALVGCETTTTVNNAPVSASSASPPEQDAGRRAGLRLKLASTYYQKGQLNVAIEEANRAIEIQPSLAEAYSLLGLVYMDLGDRPQAEANFERAIHMQPDNPEIGNNYGWYLCRTGRERQSVEYFQRAALNRRYATPAMALQNAGVCMAQAGDLEQAERLLKQSFEADAGNPITQFHLARVYLRLGRIDRAAFYYEILQRSIDGSSEVTWLGLRIARAKGDLRTEQQLADELRRRFPSSREVERLQRGQFDD